MATLDDVRRLLAAENGLAVVCTTRADGTAMASVVNAGVLDHPVTGQPSVAFVSGGGARRLEHLRRRPWITIVARSGWQWAAAEGPAELAGPDDALAGLEPGALPQLLRDVFTAAGGTHDDWAGYDRVMAEERRTAVLVRPEHVYPASRG
jgi:PPOX class probable F420-dependent enzyme